MPDKAEAPKSLKVALLYSRRLRAFGSTELRVYKAGDVVDLEYKEAHRHIGGNLADGVTSDTKVSKGESLSGTPDRKPSKKDAV